MAVKPRRTTDIICQQIEYQNKIYDIVAVNKKCR